MIKRILNLYIFAIHFPALRGRRINDLTNSRKYFEVEIFFGNLNV